MHHLSSAPDPTIALVDAAHVQMASAQRALLKAIAALEPDRDWELWGARDAAQWLAMRYDVSEWKARRWIVAAHALERLPALARALERGELGLDKVVELARFATAETEAGLIHWAQARSCAAVRRRGDREVRATAAQVPDAQASRSLSWFTFDDGRQLALQAQLPAAEGAVVVRAISRLADRVPRMPGEDPEWSLDQRRADALVAMCSAQIAADPDPDRATVVVHTTFDDLRADGNGETQTDGVIPGASLRRLLCTARVQAVIEDASGTAVGGGRTSRVVPAWLERQVRFRDRECRFPGCGARAFTQTHHIDWWRDGGRTDLDNLVLICSFHHRLVHESTAGRCAWRPTDPSSGAIPGKGVSPLVLDVSPAKRPSPTKCFTWEGHRIRRRRRDRRTGVTDDLGRYPSVPWMWRSSGAPGRKASG